MNNVDTNIFIHGECVQEGPYENTQKYKIYKCTKYVRMYLRILKLFTHKCKHWNTFMFYSREIIIDKVLMKKGTYLDIKTNY